MASDEDTVAMQLGGLKARPKQDPIDEEDPLPTRLEKGSLNPPSFEAQLKVEQSDPDSPLHSATEFHELGINKELLSGVYDMGFNKPSRIQGTALPIILGTNGTRRSNLIAQAQSGTGKTAAFTLAMLSSFDPNIPAPQVICLCPTRELAKQNYEVLKNIGKHVKFTALLAVSEADIPSRIVDPIIIGTPGKLIDLITRRRIQTRDIKLLVLDEADYMVDGQNLGDQSKRLKGSLPKTTQILLFSATYSDQVAEFAKAYVPEPVVTITLEREKLSVDKIKQFYIDCKTHENKFHVLTEVYGYLSVGQSIIFVHRVSTAQELYRRMTDSGHKVEVLYGKEMTAEQRDQTLADFRDGKFKVLISTNVLARGIDVLQVSLVINYDLPMTHTNAVDPETYLHRIGRSGRFGRDGIAINFVSDGQSKRDVLYLAEFYQREIKELKIQDIEKLEGLLENLNLPLPPNYR